VARNLQRDIWLCRKLRWPIINMAARCSNCKEFNHFKNDIGPTTRWVSYSLSRLRFHISQTGIRQQSCECDIHTHTCSLL